MAGIYVHIPFCRQACNYCNFHFATSLELKNDFVAALLKEIVFQREYLRGDQIETIYFGGGTPSLLTEGELIDIVDQIRMAYQVDPKAEITLEANPDDVNLLKLQTWKAVGINRLSIGVQSFFEDDLRWMNRAHDAKQALQSIRDIQEAGFTNFTVDLIYGTPGLSDESWEKNVRTAIELGVPHLSCYALTVEPKTPLSKMISRKLTAGMNMDDQARQFLLLMNWLADAGYEQYEISNFAKQGCRSLHNSSYWLGKKYLGLGPSAHSFDGHSRQWNVANNARYIAAIASGSLLFEKEELTRVQQLNEYIMTSLRTMEGCDISYVEKTFGMKAGSDLRINSRKYTNKNLIAGKGESLVLTMEGKLFADGISADLFFGDI